MILCGMGPVRCQQRGSASRIILDQGADQAQQLQMFRAMHPADQELANLEECRPSPGWAIWLVPDGDVSRAGITNKVPLVSVRTGVKPPRHYSSLKRDQPTCLPVWTNTDANGVRTSAMQRYCRIAGCSGFPAELPCPCSQTLVASCKASDWLRPSPS